MYERSGLIVATPKKRWNPTKRWMLAAFLLFLGVFLIYRVGLRLKIHSQLTAIRKAGQPVTLDELDKWYSAVPPAENAAIVYEKAFSLLTIDADAEDLLQLEWTNSLALPVPITPGHRGALSNLIARNSIALDFLHQGAALDRSRYPIDLKKGFNTVQPHLKKLKTSAQLLLVNSMYAAEVGKPEEAVQTLIDTLNLLRSLSNEPLALSAATEFSILEKAVRVLELLVSRGIFSDDQLELLSKEMQNLEDPGIFLRQMIGERCLGIVGFGLPARDWTGAEHESAVRLRIFLQKLFGIWDRELIIYLTITGESVEAVGLPFPQRVAKGKELEDRIGEKHDSDSGFVTLLGDHSIATLLFHNVGSGQIRSTEINARLVAAQISLAIERHRLVNAGVLPEKLDDLVPKYFTTVPLDPFDGKPYRFKSLAEGYVVYSIGSDGKDDGGLVHDRKHRESYDVTFTVGYPGKTISP